MTVVLRLFFALVCVSGCASGYYHFLHFSSRLSPFRPMPEKFDLNVLPNKTLTYFIDDGSAVQFAPGDSYSSLVSQIRTAAGAWNDVDSSDLRLAFGGLTSPGTSSSPSVEVLFAEVPPGLVAMGGPTIRAAANNSFVPILKSVVIIQPDLHDRPSYTESMASTLVHEFGHALGLQHTLTSSVMATSTTRATSKARPLANDDIAGISILYPKAGFAQGTATIAGRVTMSGQGVNLASVVAIAPNGVAVSTLTNPDGTYRLEGLPPRPYYLYVHPLPPPQEGQSTPADIVYPVDADGQTFPAGVPFETVFFTAAGGVKDPSQASVIAPPAGSPVENVNFAVRQRTGYGINSVVTYAFPGNTAVKPPYLSPGMTNPFVVAAGSGLISGNGPVSGLRATVLGGAELSIKPYPQATSSYLELDIDQRTLAVPSNTQRHVVFSANNDIYILPSAFFHVDRLPPQLVGLTPQTDGTTRTLVLLATNVSSDTRVFVDGASAAIRLFEDLGSGNGRITVVPPPASAGQRSTVTLLNSDGQSSLFVQSDNPPAYTYPSDTGAPVLSATPGNLAPGTEALVEIDGVNTSFIDGQVAVGFGTSDIAVRRTWVLSPTRLMVNLAASPSANPSALSLTVASGLQLASQTLAFSVQAPGLRPFWLASGVTNFVSGQPTVNPGSLATIQVGASPVTLTTNNVTVVFNDVRLPVLAISGNQLTFQIPQNAVPGFASIRLESGSDRSSPIGINIDPAPPRILSAALASAESRLPRPGDLLVLSVANLSPTASSVTVQVGSKDGQVVQVTADGDKESVVIHVPDDTPAGTVVPVTVSADKLTSDPVNISIGK